MNRTPRVRCPICLHLFDWPDAFDDQLDEMLYERDPDQNEYHPVELAKLETYRFTGDDPDYRAFHNWLAKEKYLRCPNPFGEDGDHFLHYRYGWYDEPLVVGMVGETKVGKSHLLAAMIGELMYGLADLRLRVSPIDPARHREYLKESVEPLLNDSRVLEGTRRRTGTVDFVDALHIARRSDGYGRTVAFYDISGEDLREGVRAADFAKIAGALIFVVDPDPSGLRRGARRSLSDRAFDQVLTMLDEAGRRQRDTGLFDLDAAVVVNKSDVIRFEQGARIWYRRPRAEGVVEVDKIMEESRDVYTLLHSRGARAWLAPVEACRLATLHIASATGTEMEGSTGLFRLPVRPRRVLEPLISLLAMAGIIDEALLVADPAESLGL